MVVQVRSTPVELDVEKFSLGALHPSPDEGLQKIQRPHRWCCSAPGQWQVPLGLGCHGWKSWSESLNEKAWKGYACADDAGIGGIGKEMISFLVSKQSTL